MSDGTGHIWQSRIFDSFDLQRLRRRLIPFALSGILLLLLATLVDLGELQRLRKLLSWNAAPRLLVLVALIVASVAWRWRWLLGRRLKVMNLGQIAAVVRGAGVGYLDAV
jgi:hypothetical protein